MSEPGSAPQRSKVGTGCGLFVLGVMGLIVVVTIITAIGTDAREVAAGDFGGDWPLTVDRGLLVCSLGQVTLVHDDVEYAVNPLAERTGLYERIDPLRADVGPGANRKMSLEPLIDAGLELCDP